jgi:hypothetical protein
LVLEIDLHVSIIFSIIHNYELKLLFLPIKNGVTRGVILLNTEPNPRVKFATRNSTFYVDLGWEFND